MRRITYLIGINENQWMLDDKEKLNRDVIINRDKFKVEETVVDKDVQFKQREKNDES